LESVVAAEKAAIHRVVDSGPTYDVFAPFASEHPYEMWVVPRRHESTFADANDAEVDGLAELLPALLRSLGRVRPGASFNWYIHGLRPATGSGGDFHWHLEVAPRLLRPDGFELGAGTTVNPVAPEVAAVELRTALASDSASGGRKR
jgi:UDPglucose--hexose-1-phosphate uridylyltransferase